MKNLTASHTSLISSLTLWAGLLVSLSVMPVSAADLPSCKARCDAENAECLVAAEDVRISERNRRKFEGIGEGEMKSLFPDLTALSPKKRAAVTEIAEFEGRYKDRVNGCRMTYNNCTTRECGFTFR